MTSWVKRRLSHSRLTETDRAAMAQPWFHNFGPLGFPTNQGEEAWAKNQIEKQGPVFRCIRDCLLRVPHDAHGVELFIQDGLFGLYALAHGAGRMDLLDAAGFFGNPDPLRSQQTVAMAKMLAVDSQCEVRQVATIELDQDYAFGICTALPCCIPDPASLLDRMRRRIHGPLVIQTPVSMQNLSADNFESPAKGRPLGSRFSLEWLVRAAVDAGWTVVSESVVELPANGPADRGSAALLCV